MKRETIRGFGCADARNLGMAQLLIEQTDRGTFVVRNDTQDISDGCEIKTESASALAHWILKNTSHTGKT